MKLATKFIVLVGLFIIAVIAVFGYLSVRRDVRLYATDMHRDAKQIGLILKNAVETTWKLEGKERAIQLLNCPGESEELPTLNWVPLSNSQGTDLESQLEVSQLTDLSNDQIVRKEDFPYRSDGWVQTFVPVRIDTQFIGAIEIKESQRELANMARQTTLRVAALAIALIAVSAATLLGAGLLLIARPLERLRDETRRIGAGDYETPIVLHSRDELDELAGAMNAMCGRLVESQKRIASETASKISALEQLRHADRLTTVGRLAAGVAHELGTPLNVVYGHAGMIARMQTLPDATVTSAKTIQSQVEKMTTIIRQLLGFARRQPSKRSTQDVAKVASKTLDLLARIAETREVDLSLVKQADPIYVQFDEAQIEQVLTNLIVNALQATSPRGRVQVEVCTKIAADPDQTALPRQCACIFVRDTGSGISPEDLTHIFEPFFTTKDVGEGTGLGLSISYSTVREHGGWISVQSEAGVGSTFGIYLPMD